MGFCCRVNVATRLGWIVGAVVAGTAILGNGEAQAQLPRAVDGQVVAAEDGIPLYRAFVRGLDFSDDAITDLRGRFTLRQVPPRSAQIVVEISGFVTDTLTLPLDLTSLVIRLERTSYELDPITVVADAPTPAARIRFDSTTQTSAFTLEPGDIVNIPGMFESDIVRVVQLLPGTIAKNDYSITYNVRGGEGDQNLVRLDGITVFNPSHLGGFFSTFDANAVERVDFFSGGFPASYPGRLSSVLDVSLQDGSSDGIHGGGQVSLISSKLVLDGPIGPATYVVGARRTYADVVIAALTPEVVPYYFTDAIAKVHLPFASGASVALTGYWGRDVMDVNVVEESDGSDPNLPARDPIDFLFDWGNQLAGVTWEQPVGKSRVVTQANITEFSTSFGIVPDLARWDNDVRLVSASSGVMTPLGRHRLHVGAGVERYDMVYNVRSPTFEFGDSPGNYGGLIPLFNVDYHPTVWSAYADDEWDVSPRLKIRPGIRVEHVPGAGFTGVAPRASFKFFLSRDRAILGSFGRYYQAVHSLRDQELPITVYEFWIGADEFVPVGRSDHAVLGFEQWFGAEYQITVEGYRKTFNNLVIPNSAQSLRDVGNQFLPMDGDAWGVDILLRRHVGRVQGWLSYGFNKTERRADGSVFPPSHDRRHTVNLVMRAPGPLGSEMGLRWGFGSPLPYTGFIGEWSHRRYRPSVNAFDQGETEPISTTINAERFPAYSRLDLGFRWQFDKWGVQWNPYLQVANAYNRKNVFLYSFDFSASPARREGVSQVPFFPTFGIEFKW